MKLLIGSGFASLLLLATVSGCAADASPSDDVAPAPSDTTVFDASAETTQAIGVARWGFTMDGASSTFRAYDAKNHVLAEVRQTSSMPDESHAHFTIAMTGPKATASEVFDLTGKVAADGVGTDVYMDVLENTFANNPVAQAILERFGTDMAASPSIGAPSGTSLVTTKSRPLEQQLLPGGQQQLGRSCSELVNDQCRQQLLDAGAADALVAQACSLVSIGTGMLIGGAVGGTRGAIAGAAGGAAAGGVGAAPGALAGGLAGALGGAAWGGVGAALKCAAYGYRARGYRQAASACQSTAQSQIAQCQGS